MASQEKDMKHDHTEIHADHHEVLEDKETLNHAYEAENREHEMALWEAIKTYPWACFWAFIMCFTIVCKLHTYHFDLLTLLSRSWNLSTCSCAAAGPLSALSSANTVS